jgi:rRNA-processing protein FCF1
MKFLLDTNFLMVPGQFRADIYSQLRLNGRAELYAVDLSVQELEKIAGGRGRNGANARLALKLMKKEGVKIVKSGKITDADEAIRRIARREGMVVCTADKRLKFELERRDIRVVSLRQKKYLTPVD